MSGQKINDNEKWEERYERAKANGNNPRTSPKGKRVATKNKPKKR